MKVKLKRPWSRAKTDEEGRIIGWDDFEAGDVVEVSKKELEYLDKDHYEELKPKLKK